MVCVKLLNCKDLEYVVSLYCPSSVQTQPSDWNDIFSHFTGKTIIAGDFNGHHTNWSVKSDTRGTQVMDAALDNDFISVNNGHATRVKLVNGILQQTSPDVSFITSDVAIKFDWQVFNENLGSDHLIIKMTANVFNTIHIHKKRNFKNANWGDYRETINRCILEFNETACNVQQITIESAANKHIPYYKLTEQPDEKFKPKNYWTPYLSQLVAQRRLSLSTFRKNPTPENFIKLEKITLESQKQIKKARNQGWQKFCNSIDEVTSAPEMWRRMRWMKGFKHQRPCIPFEKQNELLRSLTSDYVSSCIPYFNIKLRPISLISCICKTFHLMICKRIEWFVEKNKLISPYTVGFRKSQSSLDALSRLVSYIQIGFTKNAPTIACFLDIENAYNNVLNESVTKVLDEIQIGSKFCVYWVNKKKPLLASTLNELRQLKIVSSDVLKMFTLDVWVSTIQTKGVIRCDLENIKQSKE
ncbi:hypothetical protein SFRURICE_020887, partial [Spodoptera frugiperda]